jgi:hypothetical protein
VFACAVPSPLAKPVETATTADRIQVEWSQPENNGGCPILQYSVHVDDGESGDFREANAENDQQIRWKPSLRSMEIMRTAYNVGKTYRIFVKAYNYAGSSQSPWLGVTFAAVPPRPPKPEKVV